MSGYVAGAVWLSGPKERSQRFMLVAIADNANDGGLAWPSVETLAEKCLMSKRQVLRLTIALERDGWVTINRKDILKRGNSYQINLDKLDFSRPKSQVTRVTPEKKTGDISGRGQVTFSTGTGDISGIANKEERHERHERHISSLFPENEKPVEKPVKVFTLPEWIPMDSWTSYQEIRKKLKKPMTDNAKKLLVSKLDKFRAEGHSPQTMLEEATIHGWLSVYPPRSGFNPPEQAPTKRLPDPRQTLREQGIR